MLAIVIKRCSFAFLRTFIPSRLYPNVSISISRQDLPGGTIDLPVSLNCLTRLYFPLQMAVPTLSTAQRPILPPLRAVAAPAPVRLPGIEHIHSLHDSPRPSRRHAPHASVPTPRKFSTSSSVTNESRSPSPSSSLSSSPTVANSTSTSPHLHPFMRLVPSDMANAEAVVVVPPPGPKHQKPMLLIGPALKLIHHPQRRIARGARIYPYRRDSRPNNSRKASFAPTDCSES